MSIVSRAFILFTDTKEIKFTRSLVKIVWRKSPFSPFSLYARNNLVHILLQSGTFHAYYTIAKN